MTLPNLITIGRLLLVPLIIWFIVADQPLAAFGGLISGFSYWCLGAEDVQHWMYERSMPEIA